MYRPRVGNSWRDYYDFVQEYYMEDDRDFEYDHHIYESLVENSYHDGHDSWEDYSHFISDYDDNYQDRCYNRPHNTNAKKRNSQPSYHVRKFFKVLQFRHHLQIFQRVNQTGDMTPHFRKQIQELSNCVHPAGPTPELEAILRSIAEEWARQVCKALLSHYSNMYRESRQELCDFYTEYEIETHRDDAVQWAKENWTDRLQDKTISEFMKIDFKPIDRKNVDTSGEEGIERENGFQSIDRESIDVTLNNHVKEEKIEPKIDLKAKGNELVYPSSNNHTEDEDEPTHGSGKTKHVFDKQRSYTEPGPVPFSTHSKDPPPHNMEHPVAKRRQLVAKRKKITNVHSVTNQEPDGEACPLSQSASTSDQLSGDPVLRTVESDEQQVNSDHPAVTTDQNAPTPVARPIMSSSTVPPQRLRLIARRKPTISDQHQPLETLSEWEKHLQLETREGESESDERLCDLFKKIMLSEESPFDLNQQEAITNKPSPSFPVHLQKSAGINGATCPGEPVTRPGSPVVHQDKPETRSSESVPRSGESDSRQDDPVIGSDETVASTEAPVNEPDGPTILPNEPETKSDDLMKTQDGTMAKRYSAKPTTRQLQSSCSRDQTVTGRNHTMPNKDNRKLTTSRTKRFITTRGEIKISGNNPTILSDNPKESKGGKTGATNQLTKAERIISKKLVKTKQSTTTAFEPKIRVHKLTGQSKEQNKIKGDNENQWRKPILLCNKSSTETEQVKRRGIELPAGQPKNQIETKGDNSGYLNQRPKTVRFSTESVGAPINNQCRKPILLCAKSSTETRGNEVMAGQSKDPIETKGDSNQRPKRVRFFMESDSAPINRTSSGQKKEVTKEIRSFSKGLTEKKVVKTVKPSTRSSTSKTWKY